MQLDLNTRSRFQRLLAATLATIEQKEIAHARVREAEDLTEELRERCKTFSGFVKEAWHVPEPTAAYIHNWHIDAIGEHLHAVHRGEIQRLQVNMPPGEMKSLTVSVMANAWEWGPMGRPGLRYLTTCYNPEYAVRDSRKTRDLVESAWYRTLWPDIILDRRAEDDFENTYKGRRIAMPFGSLTGERGNRVVCFPYWEMIQTEDGPKPIGEIVESRSDVRVWSTNTETGTTSLKNIKAHLKNPASDLVEVVMSDGERVTCTPGHRLWTDSGWMKARSLRASDRLPCAPEFQVSNGHARKAVASTKSAMGSSGFVYLYRLFVREFCKRMFLASSEIVGLARVVGECGPCRAMPDGLNASASYAELFRQLIGGQFASGNHRGLFARQLGSRPKFVTRERSVPFGVIDILGARAVEQIVQRALIGLAIAVTDLVAGRRGANERQHDALMNKENFGRSIGACVEPRVSALSVRRTFEHPFFDGAMDAVLHHGIRPCFASDAAERADTVETFVPRYRSPLFVRYVGHVPASYCLTVDGNHTFYAGSGNGLLVSNCDDPHSTETAESDTDRRKVTRKFREGLTSRLNDPARDAIIVMMQRLHPEDICGVIEELGLPYTKLILPMEFNRSLVVKTPYYTDPRTEEGELLDPNRYSREKVEELKIEQGPHAWDTQYLQQPRAREGSYYFSRENILVSRAGLTPQSPLIWEPVERPTRCDAVFAVIDSASKQGKQRDGTGVIYVAYTKYPTPSAVILDWDIQQITAALLITWLPGVLQTAELFAKLCGARGGSGGAFIEDKDSGVVLLQQAAHLKLKAKAVPSELTALGKDGRALSVSGYVYKGMTKICREAWEKTSLYKGRTKNHCTDQITTYRMAQGTPTDDDELFDCFCYLNALCFGDKKGT